MPAVQFWGQRLGAQFDGGAVATLRDLAKWDDRRVQVHGTRTPAWIDFMEESPGTAGPAEKEQQGAEIGRRSGAGAASRCSSSGSATQGGDARPTASAPGRQGATSERADREGLGWARPLRDTARRPPVTAGTCGGLPDGTAREDVDETLEVVAWNMRAYVHGNSGSALAKRDAVEGLVSARAETAALVLTEVGGSLRQFRHRFGMGRWLRRLGFESAFLPGRRDQPAGKGATGADCRAQPMHGGVVVAWRTGTLSVAERAGRGGRLQRHARGVEEGALVVRLKRAADGGEFDIGGLYGRPSGGVACKEGRIGGILAEAADGAGALVCGDFNFKPCACFGAADATPEASRVLSAWWDAPCSCKVFCRTPAGGGGDRSELEGAVELVLPRKASGRLEGTHTRRANGVQGGYTACLDYAMALGAERGHWAVAETIEFTSASGLERLSDHKAIVFRRRVVGSTATRARRDLTRLPRDMSSEAARSFRGTFEAAAMEWEEGRWDSSADEVRALGQLVVSATRAAAATAAARAEAASRAHDGMTPAGRAEAHVRSWRQQLREVLAILHRSGEEGLMQARAVFCAAGGLGRVWRKWRTSGTRILRQRTLRECRSQLAYWLGARRAAGKQRGIAAVAALEEAVERGQPQECVRLLNETLSALRQRSTSIALTEVHEADDAALPRVHGSDPRQPKVLQAIGELGQVSFQGDGVAPVAFAAWCAQWMQKWDELRTEEDEEWTVERVVTFELFQEVLSRMARVRKAAGAGGVRLEALSAAPQWVQRRFWQGMLRCVREGAFPPEWSKVQYVLLVKKHGNQALVRERRDIALMPQDMKLLCACIKATAYARMAGRIDHAQLGFCAGIGTMDAAVLATALFQAARANRGKVYLLYCDIAKFFPAIDRSVLSVAEAWHGLPIEVRKLSAALFGEMSGAFDSAHGLGDEFDIYMGALMGCVLSPDRAKILLNTVMVAIRLHSRGVTLEGCGSRTVCSVCYCDDWLGVHETEADLRDTWAIWCTWSLVSGCGMGVVGCTKTCYVAAQWRGSKLVEAEMEAPLLAPNGLELPRMACSHAYKHLGFPRTADGSGDAVRVYVRKLVVGFVARLRVLRNVRAEEFVAASNAVMQGVGGYYGSAVWMSWEVADGIEGVWREEFRRRYGGARSTPRLFYYVGLDGATGRGLRREHLHVVMSAAAYEGVARAMCDPHDGDARAAARAMVAASARRWGCRGRVLEWDPTHAAGAMEERLRRKGHDWLGDAFWVVRARVVASLPTGRRAIVEIMDSDPEDPLCRAGAGFCSTPLWEVGEHGGAALRVRSDLVGAGVVQASDMCIQGTGAGWLWMGAAEAHEVGVIGGGALVATEWTAVLAELRGAGYTPCGGDGRGYAAVIARRRDGTRRPAGEANVQRVSEAALAELASAVASERSGGAGTVTAARRTVARGEVSVESRCGHDFAGLMRAAFGSPERAPAQGWRHGQHERKAAARLVYVLPHGVLHDDRGAKESRDEPASFDSATAEAERRRWAIDEEGYAQHDGARVWDMVSVAEAEAAGTAVPPLVKLHVISREHLSEAGAMVLSEIPGCATRAERREAETAGNFVHAQTTREEWLRMHAACDTYDVRAVWCTDGSRRWLGGTEDGAYVASRAALRHCGQVAGGRLAAHDSYHTELAALIDALDAETERRVMIILDASSPAEAVRKWRRLHDRRRAGYYLDAELAALVERLDKFEAVVFFWTSSHKGVVVNEMADALAARALGDERVTPVLEATSNDMHVSLGLGARRSNREAATVASRRVVLSKLRAASVDSVWAVAGEWGGTGLGTARMEHVTRALAGRRWCLGDEKTVVGSLRRRVRTAGCACCGLGAQQDWLHMCFGCGALRAERAVLRKAVTKLTPLLAGRAAPHSQCTALERACEAGLDGARPKLWLPPGAANMRMQTLEEALRDSVPTRGEDGEVVLLRAVCAMWDAPAGKAMAGAAAAAMEVRVAVHALACKYEEMAVVQLDSLKEEADRHGSLREALGRLQAMTRRAGPARLRAAREARLGAAAAWAGREWASDGRMDSAAVGRVLAAHLADRRGKQRAEMGTPDRARRRARDAGESWSRFEGEGTLGFTPKGGRAAAAAARRGTAVFVCDRLFEGEAWRRLRLDGAGLDVRIGEGGLMEVEMPTVEARTEGGFVVPARDLMLEASPRERLGHGLTSGWAGGCALAWLVEKGRLSHRSASATDARALGRRERARQAMERQVRRECGLAVTAVRRAAGGRVLHAATWDDLQWATASGAGAARRRITTDVDEDQGAGLASERAMRCARHVSECREERDAVAAGGWARLRRVRRQAASRVSGAGGAGDGTTGQAGVRVSCDSGTPRGGGQGASRSHVGRPTVGDGERRGCGQATHYD